MHDWPFTDSPDDSTSSPAASPRTSTSYARFASSKVLCTANPKDPSSLEPTTDTYAVSLIATSSLSTSLYDICTGRRLVSAVHGETRANSAAAAKRDPPNASVKPSTDCDRPGRCCVPHSWLSGAIEGSICVRMMDSMRSGGTGAKPTSSTPHSASPARHPSTYGHAVSPAHLSFSPRCRDAVWVSANRIDSGRAALRFSPAAVVFITLGWVITFLRKSRRASGVGRSFTTLPPPASSSPDAGSHARNWPSLVEITSIRWGRTGEPSSPMTYARSLWT
mmetsp:Transcript_9898/g.38612  ORF Transcript_9898/g.38612 Transcript_9898/m.38612 type:complete len:278 (-) Transcript_9898:65-898(-)